MGKSPESTSTGLVVDIACRRLRMRPLILIVDDSPDALTILRFLLLAEGYAVVTAGSVSEALCEISTQAPDLLITDYVMPGLSGMELCRHLRADAATQHIPIIVHTALDLAPEATALYEWLFVKPTDPAALVAEVRSLLSRTPARST